MTRPTSAPTCTRSAIMVYQMLTGQKPYVGENPPSEILAQHREAPLPLLPEPSEAIRSFCSACSRSAPQSESRALAS